jgi:protein-tyrosine phosphatase
MSQPLSGRLVRHADLIFTMTQAHRAAIVSQWPDAAARTRMLGGDDGDIPDPIGGSKETYRRCAAQIEIALRKRIEESEFDEIRS